MYIKDLFENGKNVVSFEVFPPKNDDDVNKLYATIADLEELCPDYISVTFGAGGSTRGKSAEIANHIKNNMEIEVLAHLTCVNSSKDDINNILDDFKKNNIDNILALRGDPPAGQTNFTKTIGGFGYASELTDFIKKNHNFCIGVAAYPEKHIESDSLESDINNLIKKVDAGADFIVTQLFFDNNDFFRFRDICVKKGVKIPIVPGILPILNYSSVKRITELCGSKIPQNLKDTLEKNVNDKLAIENIGIDYAIKQIDNLLDNEIDGVHFYTMNKSEQIKKIYMTLKNKFKRIKTI